MLGHDIHSYLAQIQVGPDAGGGSDPGFPEHAADHLLDHGTGAPPITFQIRRQIQQDLIH